MSNTRKCPACGESISLPIDVSRNRVPCPACGIELTTNEDGDLAVEGVRSATTSNVASVPKPPPKLEDIEDEDEWDEDIPRRQPWRRRYSRAAALKKVRPPAILLQVLGVVWVIAATATIPILLLVPLDLSDKDYLATMIGGIVGAILGAILGVVTFIAGMRMKALRSFPLILTVVILTMALGVAACLPVAMIPIWPLVVLVSSDVRAGFEMTKEERAKADAHRDKENSTDE
jgi:hypothetical protein